MQTEMTVADGERFAAIVWQTYAKYFNVTVEPLNQRKKESKQDDRRCKDCVERFVGCHASCPRYAKFKAGCEARREARTKLHPIADYTIDITKRVQKAEHRRRK